MSTTKRFTDSEAQMDRHLSREEVLEGFRVGLDDRLRLRSIVHLGTGCQECAQVLRELAREYRCRREDRLVADPVGRALARSVSILQNSKLPVPLEGTPVHLHWTRRLACDPAVFPRMVLEESLLMRPGDNCLPELFSHDALAPLGDERWHGLRCLAQAYAGYTSVIRGEPVTEDRFHESDAILSRIEDAEILALYQAFKARVLAPSGYRWEPSIEAARSHLYRFCDAGSLTQPLHFATVATVAMMEAFCYEARPPLLELARERYVQVFVVSPESCPGWRMTAAYRLTLLSLGLHDFLCFKIFLQACERLVETWPDLAEGYRLSLLALRFILAGHEARLDETKLKLWKALDFDRSSRSRVTYALWHLLFELDEQEASREKLYEVIGDPSLGPWQSGEVESILAMMEIMEIPARETVRERLMKVAGSLGVAAPDGSDLAP